MPVLILREGGPVLIDPHVNAVTPQHIPVPLDGSALAKAVLAPVASLCAALTASSRGTLHLTRIVHPDEVKKDVCALEAAQLYLSTVVARHVLGQETICSVVIHGDVASALIMRAEQGKQASKDIGESRCDLMALATHGRSGLQRLVMGNFTVCVLSSAIVPLLIVPSLAQHTHETDPRSPLA
jgi:nucleotide-binding universal stress UspA family protein